MESLTAEDNIGPTLQKRQNQEVSKYVKEMTVSPRTISSTEKNRFEVVDIRFKLLVSVLAG